MRSKKVVEEEIERLQKLTYKSQTKEYANFLHGAYVGLLWAAGLDGLWNKSSKFLRPSSKLRKGELDD